VAGRPGTDRRAFAVPLAAPKARNVLSDYTALFASAVTLSCSTGEHELLEEGRNHGSGTLGAEEAVVTPATKGGSQ